MAHSKAHRFEADDFHFSLVAKAFAHPARIGILRKLSSNQECSVRELHEGIGLSNASMSQHLKVLRELQIVLGREEYPTVIYRLNTDLPKTQSIIRSLLVTIDKLGTTWKRLDELGRIAQVRLLAMGEREGG